MQARFDCDPTGLVPAVPAGHSKGVLYALAQMPLFSTPLKTVPRAPALSVAWLSSAGGPRGLLNRAVVASTGAPGR